MKILLIDDKANAGWKQVLQYIFPIPNLEIDVALNYKTAINCLERKYDLIFLDVRLNSEDHENHQIEKFTGYKILQGIKKDFTIINFSTPIVLLTASNKIWNIDAFREFGIDSYYIKEHPNTIYSEEVSRQNYEHLLKSFDHLIDIGPKRYDIWNISNQIIKKVSNHNYFKGDKKYENIKNRIIDKLLLGYSYLFNQESLLEKNILKTNNEALAFIIYFSILEEIVKGYSYYDSWDLVRKTLNFWKFRNNEYFIEFINYDTLRVNVVKNEGKFKPQQTELKRYENKSAYSYYLSGRIDLNEQIHSLLAAYTIDNRAQFNSLAKSFNQVRQFRNNVDYIHGNVYTIYNKNLVSEEDKEEHYNKSIEVLHFILNVLKLI